MQNTNCRKKSLCKDYSSCEMCCKLTDTTTHVSPVCGKRAGPGGHMAGGRRPCFSTSTWPCLFRGVESHESQKHLGKVPQPAQNLGSPPGSLGWHEDTNTGPHGPRGLPGHVQVQRGCLLFADVLPAPFNPSTTLLLVRRHQHFRSLHIHCQFFWK